MRLTFGTNGIDDFSQWDKKMFVNVTAKIIGNAEMSDIFFDVLPIQHYIKF